MYRFTVKSPDRDGGEPRAGRWTSRGDRWSTSGRLGVNLGGVVCCGGPIIRHSPIPHRATVVPAGPPQARPAATPGPAPGHPLRTCCRHRYAAAQTPWYDWLSSGQLDTVGAGWTQQTPLALSRGSAGPPRGGAGAPQGMRNPFTFLGQNSHLDLPQSPFTFLGQKSPPKFTPIPPPPPIPPTTHTWLIEVNRGCAKVSIGCLAVGLYVPASAVQKTIGDYR